MKFERSAPVFNEVHSHWSVRLGVQMAKFHFVEDYQKPVDHLVATKPIDEAMSIAVGGAYHQVGAIERDLVRRAGLKDGMTLIDQRLQPVHPSTALRNVLIHGRPASEFFKSGGKLVFSFLEFANPEHWCSFMGEVAGRRTGHGAPLNTLIERPVVQKWADALGYKLETIVDGTEAPWGGHRCGRALTCSQSP